MCDLVAITGNYELTSGFLYFIYQANARKLRKIQKVAAEVKALIAPGMRTGQLQNVQMYYRPGTGGLHVGDGSRFIFMCQEAVLFS